MDRGNRFSGPSDDWVQDKRESDLRGRIIELEEQANLDKDFIRQYQRQVAELEAKLRGMVTWLEQHQLDVFSRGIWEAIAQAEQQGGQQDE